MDIILKKPIISEQTMKLAGNGVYTFIVADRVKKPQIAKAVAELFGVEVLAVKTLTYKDEKKMQRAKRKFIFVGGHKKVFVTVKPGQKIALFDIEDKKSDEVVVTSAEGESQVEVKEKKSLLKGTKVKVEKKSSAKNKVAGKKGGK